MLQGRTRAREDRQVLTDCGWILQNCSSINLSAGRGIAIREGLLKGGEADAFGERLSPLMDELNLPLAA
jgi:hypothetical protein